MEGVDHARSFLRERRGDEELSDLMWYAVAPPTPVGIVNCDRRFEVALTAFGRVLATRGIGAEQLGAREIERILDEWPRAVSQGGSPAARLGAGVHLSSAGHAGQLLPFSSFRSGRVGETASRKQSLPGCAICLVEPST